jgi:hypothetical protein
MGAMTEPESMLRFHIFRLTPKQYADFLQGNAIYVNRFFGSQRTSFQSDTVTYIVPEKFGWKKYKVFRKDIKLSDGDFVVAGAALVDNEGLIPNKEADVQAITEIINSIEQLKSP